MLHDDDAKQALARACAGVEAALAKSGEADELQLVVDPETWANPEPWPLTAADG